MKPRLVILTGAGISAESGIRTFRGALGLWGDVIAEPATVGVKTLAAKLAGFIVEPAEPLSAGGKPLRAQKCPKNAFLP